MYHHHLFSSEEDRSCGQCWPSWRRTSECSWWRCWRAIKVEGRSVKISARRRSQSMTKEYIDLFGTGKKDFMDSMVRVDGRWWCGSNLLFGRGRRRRRSWDCMICAHPGEFEQSWGGGPSFSILCTAQGRSSGWQYLIVVERARMCTNWVGGIAANRWGLSSIFRGKSSKVSLIGGFWGGRVSANAVVQVGKIRYLEVEKICLISKSVMAIFII